MITVSRNTLFLRGCMLVCLFLAVAAWQAAEAQPLPKKMKPQKTFSKPLLVKEYHLDGKGTINVFTISGNINMVSVPQTHTVRIELYANQGFSLWPRSDPFKNYRITSLKRGNEVITSVEKKGDRESGFWGGHTTFSYKITVPTSVSTNLKTLNGGIKLGRVEGRQILKSNAGNIEIKGVQGTLKAYTSGGDININDSEGTVFVRSDGGNIHTNNIDGELRLRSNGGNVYSTGISGSMVAVVSGGDIEARFDRVQKGINLVTHGGDLHLSVPRSSGYQLSAVGNSVDFPRPETFKGNYSQTAAHGLINGGGVPIDLEALSGNVTLKLKE